MAQPSDNAAYLAEKAKELVIRKGPHSVIVRTLRDALRSGTDEDLRRGKIAFDIWQQTGEQRRLLDIPKAVPKLPKIPPVASDPKQEELRVWAEAFEKKMSQPRNEFSETNYRSALSEDIDFSRADRLSTSKRRQCLARRPRPKLRPKPRPRRR
jgi:hypothetical protein